MVPGPAGLAHAVRCPRTTSASTCSSPHPPEASAHPMVPVFPLAGSADLPVEVLPELQAGSGRVPLQRDRQAPRPCRAPEQELVAYFPGSPPSPSSLRQVPPCQHLPGSKAVICQGAQAGNPEGWVLLEEGAVLLLWVRHLSPLW